MKAATKSREERRQALLWPAVHLEEEGERRQALLGAAVRFEEEGSVEER